MYRELFILLLLAASGLGQADTSPERICGKLPMDDPKRESRPAFRLGCERGADDREQVQLLIEGEQAIHLTGVDGESLGSEPVIFDPDSVSVRLLEGQPNLYWITYDLKSEDWRGYEVNRRHRVVRASDPEQSLFDEWTEEGSKSGSFNAYADWSDDYVVTYQGTTLRVVNVKFDDRGTGDNEDCVRCVEAHENCPAFCEGFVCTLPSAESVERCEEVCLRDCESKDWVQECYVGKETQKSYLRKRIREIDVQTGLVKSDHRFQLNNFIPGWYRCSGKALHFYVLDDGISSWLLVRDQTLFGQDGETPEPTPFDPENPGQVSAIATCWLYNRVPWNNANATRLYPPAPPDQMRPEQFVPEHCCVVETSADGKWTALYENLKAEQDGEEAGRLLAIFDGSSQSCFSANLLKEGRWGKTLFDWVGNPVFCPDGGKLAYRARQGSRWFVVVDDRRGPEFDRVGSPVFSPDGRQLAYWARQGKKEFIVLDDRKGPTFDGAGFPVFSPDGGQVAYRAREGNRWFVLRGAEKGPAFDDIGYYTAPDTGRGSDIADVVFSPDGRQLAYAARRGAQWFIVRDGQPGPAFDHVGLPVFGPDGRLAHRARQNDREFILLAGQKGPEFDFVGNPVFSPDGREVAYWAQQGEAEFILHGERKGPTFAQVGAPVFDRNGRQVVYWAMRKEHTQAEPSPDGDIRKEFIMYGERKGPEFDAIESPVFHPHTGQIAYRVRQRNKEFVMLGDRKGPEFDFADSSRSRPLAFTPDARQLAYRAKQDGKEFILLGENKGPSFDEVGNPVFSPDGGRLAYRARLGGQASPQWLMVVSALENRKTAAGAQAIAPWTVPFTKRVPQLLPHPVVVGGNLLGGATKSRWIDTDTFTPSDLEADQCRMLNPETLPTGLRYKFYAFDKALGQCTGGPASVCLSGSSGTTHLRVDFPECAVRDYKIALAAPWNALPRRPRIIKDRQPYLPIVGKFLEDRGHKQLTILIESIHGIDLDGDGKEEFVINTQSRKELPEDRSAKYFSMVLLVRSTNGRNEAIAIDEGRWTQEHQGDFEDFHDIRYADVNGDGILEIFVDWSRSAEFATRVYTLKDGQPVATALGFYEGD